MDLDDRPWDGLPGAIAAAVRDRADEIVDDIVATVQVAIPAYAHSRAQTEAAHAALGRVRLGIEQGLRHFATLIEDPSATVGDHAETYRQLGRATHDSGSGLDAMNAVFRVVARTTWRWTEGILAVTESPPDAPLRVAEAVFVYVDALSLFVAEGYAEAVAAAAGERHASRSRLAELLLHPGDAARGALLDAARAARWPVPATVTAVALGPAERADEIAGQIDPDVLAGSSGGGACLLIPNPSTPRRQTLIERALSDRHAAIGPEVPTGLADRSLAWARQLLDLDLRAGAQQRSTPARADQRVVELLLQQDPALLTWFVERRLAPLRALPDGARARLSATLLAWLKHGSAPKAGAELNAHTQTVRYRLAQIRELFPDELDDPDARFELELALRAERLSPDDD